MAKYTLMIWSPYPFLKTKTRAYFLGFLLLYLYPLFIFGQNSELPDNQAGERSGAGEVPAVSWLNLIATPENQKVRLDWAITTEKDIRLYQIQRSSDGEVFVAVVNHISRGNTDTYRSYRAYDLHPLESNSFYRLKAVGEDGSVHFSPVVKVDLSKIEPLITVYPNPLKQDQALNIAILLPETSRIKIRLVSAQGQALRSQNPELPAGTELVPLNTEGLPPGIYFLHLETSYWSGYKQISITK